jgi:putative Mg2+ transporter-C (MgtC) family protein
VIDLQTSAIRIALALLFGAVIGIDREWRQKNAGLKTNALVAIGAAAFAMLSNTFGPGNHNPAQMAAAVVTGIGFIGAGVIMHHGFTVEGVTTAATLWANASVGVAVGLGHTQLAAIVVAGILIVQVMLRRVETWIMRASSRGGRSGRRSNEADQ